MNRWIKISGIALAVLIVLALVLTLALPRLLDPNAYRDDLTRLVSEQTGRTLTLEGDLGVSVFPWLGLEVNGASLANAPGFGEEPMLVVRHAAARIRLLPLLAGRLEFGTIALDGLQLSLARAADGRSNWQDIQERLARSEETSETTPEAESPSQTDGRFSLSEFNITGVRVQEGRLLWDDRQNGTRYALTDWDLKTGQVRFGGKVPVTSSFNLSVGAPDLDAEVDFEAGVQVAPEAGRYVVEDLMLETRLRSPELFGEAVLPVALSGAGVWQQDAPGTLGPIRLEVGPYKTAGQQIDKLVLTVDEGVVDVARSIARLAQVKLSGENIRWAGSALDSLDLQTGGEVNWGSGRVELASVRLQAKALRPTADMAPVALDARTPVSVDWKRQRLEAPDLGVTLDGKLAVAGGQGLLDPSLSGKLDYDWGAGRARLNDMRLLAESLDLGDGRVLARPEITTDVAGALSDQRWSLKPLNLRVGDLFRAQGNIDITAARGFGYQGRIDAPPFAPRPLFTALKIELPPTTASDTLRTLAVNTAFKGTAERVALDDLRVDLDGGRMQGSAAIAWDERMQVKTDLTVDRLNVDRYLPPTSGSAPEPKPATGTAPAGDPGPQPIPVALLRQFDLDTRLRVGALTLSRIAMQNAEIRAVLKDGRLVVDPLQAGLFGGQMTTTMQIDAAPEVPTVTIKPVFKGIQLAPLMQRFAGEAYLTGTGTLDLNAATRGADTGQWLRNLDGLLSVDLRDGRIERIDILNQLRRGYAQVRSLDPGPAPEGGTEFTELKGKVSMKGPIWRNEALSLTSPLLRMDGKGQIDVDRQQLDFDVLATLLGTGMIRGDRWLEDLIDKPIPIAIKGPWARPSVRPDVKALAEAKARERLEQEKQKIQEKLKDREDELREKAAEKIQEGLGKFLR